jgi:tetratricopeptide (TPR) repeat protein
MKLAAVIMIKNEAKRIGVTIASVIDKVDGIVLYDTGSEDDSVEIVERVANGRVPVHVRRGEFVDFASSRNESLNFADEFNYDHLVLLDANDEMVGTRPSISKDDETTAWYVEQKIKHTETVSFWNIRLIKAKSGLRYEGAVHEYLTGYDRSTRMLDFHLFQDKTLDDDEKSARRWIRDLELLKMENQNQRTLFYIAQTLQCLDRPTEAYEYYSRLASIDTASAEIKFVACQQCGQIGASAEWFLKAFHHQARAEPLICLAEIERHLGQFDLATAYARLACELPYPSDAVLTVSPKCYSYTRWHVLSVVSIRSSYADRIEVGRAACINALKVGCNVPVDSANLAIYESSQN